LDIGIGVNIRVEKIVYYSMFWFGFEKVLHRYKHK